MKLKMLKGIAYNVCDRARGVPFIVDHLQKAKLPDSGEWKVDLKKNLAKDQDGKSIKLTFTKFYHDWFVKEIKKAGIRLEHIEIAELILKFDFKNKKPIICSCKIKADGKTYSYKVVFTLF